MATHEVFSDQTEDGTSDVVTCYGDVRVMFVSPLSSSVMIQTQVAPIDSDVFSTVEVSVHGTPFIVSCGSSGLQIRQVLTGYNDNKSTPVSSVIIEDEAEE